MFSSESSCRWCAKPWFSCEFTVMFKLIMNCTHEQRCIFSSECYVQPPSGQEVPISLFLSKFHAWLYIEWYINFAIAICTGLVCCGIVKTCKHGSWCHLNLFFRGGFLGHTNSTWMFSHNHQIDYYRLIITRSNSWQYHLQTYTIGINV